MAVEKTESIVTPSGNDINPKAELGHVHSLQESAISDALDEQEEKKLLKKIDLWLMPLLTVAYMLQFLDKVSLSYASIMGIIQDLNLIGTDYTWSSSVFYFGFLAFSYPASFLMVRLPLGKYLAVTCISWSVVLACHAAVSNFGGLIAVRFFLGATEASISPGFSLITGMWYKRQEQPFRHGLWFFGNSVSAMFGGLLAYGIAHITVSIEAWRWLFIILGIITFAWGVVLLLFLPDQPGSARFLSQDERVKAVDRIRRNQTGVKDSHFRWAQVREAFVDPQVWLLIIFQLAFCISNGGFITFSNIVIAGFGFKTLDVYLLNIPIGVAHAIFSLGATFLCGRLPGSRTLVAAALSIVSLIGSMLVRFGPNTGSKLAGMYLMIAFVAGFPISLSMISSNVAGFTKKAVASAMMFVAYCAGNIAGPFLFFASEAPVYQSGFIATAICFGASALAMFALRTYLIYENRRRDQLQAGNQPTIRPTAEQAHSSALSDPTDKENQSFRYVY